MSEPQETIREDNDGEDVDVEDVPGAVPASEAETPTPVRMPEEVPINIEE